MQHSNPRVGILLVNIGSPDRPSPVAVRRYLAEFLADPRIVELPRWLWLPLLQGVILNVRSFRSARAYRRVWRPEGSPLVHYTQRIASGLATRLASRLGTEIPVAVGMRYGQPNLAGALGGLVRAGVSRVLVLPLHPQYCASTVASAFDGVALAWARMRRLPEQRLVNGYYDHPGYIRALAASVRDHWSRAGGQRHLLMSYHSIPLAYARRGDPYPEHVRETSGLLARELGLGSGEWSLGFQSRVLGGRWLEPATEAVLTSLAAGGVRRVSVISPVFPTDCLETLDDLVVQARIQFIRNGGDELDVVPALNDRDDHLDFLACLAEERCAGWFGPARGDGRASVVPLARRS